MHTQQAVSEVSDEDLVAKIQEGQTQLFTHIVERYQTRLMAYGRRLLYNPTDLEDIVQEIFIKVYENLLSFDAKRKFSPWIYRIAHNEFINKGKKFSRQLVDYFDFDVLFPHPVAKGTPESELSSKELKEAAEKSLEQLEDKYREPLYLYLFENLEYQEIADVMRIPVNTVGVRIMRAKKMLTNHFMTNYERPTTKK